MGELQTKSIGIQYTDAGTQYGTEGAKLYASVRHGPDGVFLDPAFLSHISDLNGETIADIGAGAGPWSVFSAEHGAGRVIAVDYQMPMLENAKNAIDEKNRTIPGIKDKIVLVQADAALLPIPDNSCDKAISINVGCNLPDTQVKDFIKDDEKNYQVELGFGPHFSEAHRILKQGGEFVVTAPINFGTVFTDGSASEQDIIAQLNIELDKVENHGDKTTLASLIKGFTHVYRATFAWRNRNGQNRLVLITDESELIPGEDILRKLPGLAVPNRYHRETDYIEEAKKAGFDIKDTTKMCFTTEQERADYNQNVDEDKRLGPEYVGKSPFVVFTFIKPEKAMSPVAT